MINAVGSKSLFTKLLEGLIDGAASPANFQESRIFVQPISFQATWRGFTGIGPKREDALDDLYKQLLRGVFAEEIISNIADEEDE